MIDDEDLDGTVWQSRFQARPFLNPLAYRGERAYLILGNRVESAQPAAESAFGRNRSKEKADSSGKKPPWE